MITILPMVGLAGVVVLVGDNSSDVNLLRIRGRRISLLSVYSQCSMLTLFGGRAAHHQVGQSISLFLESMGST